MPHVGNAFTAGPELPGVQGELPQEARLRMPGRTFSEQGGGGGSTFRAYPTDTGELNHGKGLPISDLIPPEASSTSTSPSLLFNAQVPGVGCQGCQQG